MHVMTHPKSQNPSLCRLGSFLGMPLDEMEKPVGFKNNAPSFPYQRKILADVLEKYNHEIGNDAFALQNARRIEEDHRFCVVTGQQLGFMGGPTYTILKGLSCLLVARKTKSIPVFWIATEDHDIPEIDHTYLIDSLGNLKRFPISLPKEGSQVEDIKLSAKNIEEIQNFWSYLGIQGIPLPSIGDLYSEAMIKVLVRLFTGTGMVFLEPKLLRTLAIPFLKKEITDFKEINDVLKTTTKQLQEAGGRPQIDVGEGTNLFLKDKQHQRMKLRFDGQAFIAGNESYHLEDLLEKVQNEPESFSTNVAARPVLQNIILPVIAYIAGPSEIAYHRQLGDYHLFHGTSMPCLVPRLSATFIPPDAARILETCQLNPWDQIPHNWQDVFPLIQQKGEAMIAQWQECAKHFFDKDLSLSAIERYAKLGGKKLIHRAYKAHIQKKGLSGESLHLLKNLINPHNNPQERLLNWWGFQTKTQENLVLECLDKISWDSASHHYIYL